MDLLSSIRKSGSRGGVNFSWDEVQTSQHRENYLGHSLMAPVGRWQKGKDLSWYAKGDDKPGDDGETAEEKSIRERKEEIRRIKEAEEDALARALGLPVADRNVSGANAVSVGEVNRMVKEVGVGEEGEDDGGMGRGKGFGDFVGKLDGREAMDKVEDEDEKGGIGTDIQAESGDTGGIDTVRGAARGEGIGLGVLTGTDGTKERCGGRGAVVALKEGSANIEAGVQMAGPEIARVGEDTLRDLEGVGLLNHETTGEDE
ncbi:hypothetical protein EG329_011826 [Mollisiaceae sp. DMI_Dod_QoI]|nr:hypothetical protein EG329_011826 [Helotiales sp. DMI_Dod_QoI]